MNKTIFGGISSRLSTKRNSFCYDLGIYLYVCRKKCDKKIFFVKFLKLSQKKQGAQITSKTKKKQTISSKLRNIQQSFMQVYPGRRFGSRTTLHLVDLVESRATR